MKKELYDELIKLKNQVDTRSSYLKAKEQGLKALELKLNGGNKVFGGDPRNLKSNLERAGGDVLTPGNVGDINRVIWPFYFTTQQVTLAPNTTAKTGFTVTQEAAFIFMSYTKAVYTFDGVNVFTYIDPEQPGAAGSAFDLTFNFRDSQSGRDFQNFPILTDTVGVPRFPTKLPKPMLIQPNANIEISFTNNNATLTYVPFITVFGYRCRIEDARGILSFVST